jgi:hypothetical protein
MRAWCTLHPGKSIRKQLKISTQSLPTRFVSCSPSPFGVTYCDTGSILCEVEIIRWQARFENHGRHDSAFPPYSLLHVADVSPQCIKFKTYSSIFLNRFEALNLSIMQKMQNKRPAPIAQALGTPDSIKDADQTRAASPLISQPAGPAAGGVKKKKPKKKK